MGLRAHALHHPVINMTITRAVRADNENKVPAGCSFRPWWFHCLPWGRRPRADNETTRAENCSPRAPYFSCLARTCSSYSHYPHFFSNIDSWRTQIWVFFQLKLENVWILVIHVDHVTCHVIKLFAKWVIKQIFAIVCPRRGQTMKKNCPRPSSQSA